MAVESAAGVVAAVVTAAGVVVAAVVFAADVVAAMTASLLSEVALAKEWATG